MKDIYIKNGSVVFEDDVKLTDIYLSGGKIKFIGNSLKVGIKSNNCTVIDARDMYIFPGFLDVHTHYGVGNGSSVSADDFFTGSRAAAYGGITTVIDFSDQLHGKRLKEAVATRITEARKSVIDFTFHQGVYRYHEDIEAEVSELASFGVRALKVYTTYKDIGLYLDSGYWDRLFGICKKYCMLVTVHAESEQVLEQIGELYVRRNELPPSFQNLLRPATAEALAICEIGKVAEAHGLPLYIVHLSSSMGLDAIRTLRKSMRVCAETAPHYLLLSDERLSSEGGNLFIINPPLRSREDNKALLEAISREEIEIIATDHCAYTIQQKMGPKDCREVLAGIPGSEILASLVYSYVVKTGHISLSGMRKLLCDNPAKIFGLYPRKGSLEVGSDADIVLFKEIDPHQITISELHGGADYTPYEGIFVSGKPVCTIKGGKRIIDNGNFYGVAGDGNFLPCGISSLFGAEHISNS